MLQSKDVLHQVIFGNGQLKDKLCSVIFNKQPDLLKKAVPNPDPYKLNEMCNRDEMRLINSGFTDCPYNKEQLEKFFDTEKLGKIVKIKTYFFDASDTKECKKVFKDMGEDIYMVQKDEKKAMEKAKKEAEDAKKWEQ